VGEGAVVSHVGVRHQKLAGEEGDDEVEENADGGNLRVCQGEVDPAVVQKLPVGLLNGLDALDQAAQRDRLQLAASLAAAQCFECPIVWQPN